MVLEYGLKGQRSKTFVKFGHMGSNIKKTVGFVRSS